MPNAFPENVILTCKLQVFEAKATHTGDKDLYLLSFIMCKTSLYQCDCCISSTVIAHACGMCKQTNSWMYCFHSNTHFIYKSFTCKFKGLKSGGPDMCIEFTKLCTYKKELGWILYFR